MLRTPLRTCSPVGLYITARSISVSTETTSPIKELAVSSLNGTRIRPVTKSIKFKDALPYEDIPGPKPLPVIGNAWRFLPYMGFLGDLDLTDMYTMLQRKYGDVVLIRTGRSIADRVVLFSPEDFETAFRYESRYPVRDVFKAFNHYQKVMRKDIFQGTAALATLQGQEWYERRSTMNPLLMTPGIVLQYISPLNTIGDDLLETMRILNKIDNETPGNFINYLNRWALESIGTVALDKRFGAIGKTLLTNEEPQALIDAVLNMFKLLGRLEFIPSYGKYYDMLLKQYVKCLDTITFLLLKYIDEVTLKIDKQSSPEHEANLDKHPTSIFQHLLEHSPNIALTTAMDMIVAGVDTTGKTAASTLYHLSKNPDVQTKLRQELLNLLPNKDSPITKETLVEVPYLRAVIKESMRLSPISIANVRTTVDDIVIGQYQIPKGKNIITGQSFLHHSDKQFLRPKDFIPERWLKTTPEKLLNKDAHPFSYMPFGFGPRTCIGKRLAQLELEIVIAKIIRNFTLTWLRKDAKFSAQPLYAIVSPLKIHLQELSN